MQEITFEIDAQRVGRASGYLGGLTVERYTFTGATIPAGTRLAILTRAGGLIAAATIAEGNAAEVDTNTQEVADLLRYQPLGACESVYIALGDADNILAIIPATMRKNWLDDEATHPPVPANRYPTKTELDEWLARFDERATAAETAKEDAQSAAEQSAQRATAAQNAQTAAERAAAAAQTAQEGAESAKEAAAQSATDAEAAKEAAAQSATAAANSAQEAADGVTALLQGKVDAAEAAKTGAEAAKTAAETAKAGADAAKSAAASSATAAANSATAASKSATDLADAVATAKSLDGRVTAIEDEGIAYYNPLKGTPFIIEREIIAGVYLVRLRDYPSHPFSLTSDGEYYIIQKHYNPGKVWLLDKDLKPLREIATGFNYNAHSPAFIHNGQLWVSNLSSTWMPSNKTGIICVYDVSDASSAPTVVAKTMKIIGDYNNNDIIALFLNRLTGNVLCIRNTMVNTGSYALEVYRLTVDGDTFAYEYVQTLDGVSLSGNNPYPLINYFANRVFVTLVQCQHGYDVGFNPYGDVYPVTRPVESRLLVTGYDDHLHWIDTALPPYSNTAELPIRFGVSAVGTYFGSSVSSNIMTSATPGLQYHSTKSYTDKNGVSRPAVLMTNGVATFFSDGEDDDGNLIWKTNWDCLFNSGSFGLFTPAGAYSPAVLCAGTAEGDPNGNYIRPTAFVYRGDTSLSAQAVGNCIRVKTTGGGGGGQNGIILLGESGNVGVAGYYGSSGGLVGSNYGVACDRHNVSPTALVFTRP